MCNLKIEAMDRAGELPLEKKMEDREMFRELKDLSGASVRPAEAKAAEGGAVRGEAVAITAANAVHILRLALVNAECAIKGREHTGFITRALVATEGDFRATAADYEEVLTDHRRLVRELDVALNGEAGAAKQASLGDIVRQVKREGIRSAPVSARAADAPSEPSELVKRLRTHASLFKVDCEPYADVLAAADALDNQPRDVLAENILLARHDPSALDSQQSITAKLKDWQAYAFSTSLDERNGDLCQLITELLALDSQPTDFEDRPLKARVLRNELAIIIGCQDGRSGKEKADAVLHWIETQGKHVFVSASSQPTDGEVRNG